ncbi:hypothetical protein P691DRAFT_775190 [Macrolepiota fuliginosa MF-IS2]|uniref:Uncharacterized protein n=1 Tax=Macrolepiota fuliginosa MF-IS2 TaxID=1400762 RepID=A0A9P6C514_9AGAR|nr:hypothetical protein P691DRAFT_775190 [Macrolepiota fuliginosa MF-IS2]
MEHFSQNSIYLIKNVLFNAYVGRATHEDTTMSFRPIVGIRFDYDARTKFEVSFENGGETVTMTIGGATVGEYNMLVGACETPGVEGDEWLVQLADKGSGRLLYRIALARSPDLVWTLNLPTEPANQVHLQPYVEGNHRQLWELQEIPF